MKKLGDLALWLLIIGGLLAGWDALTGRDLIAAVAGHSSLEALAKGAIGVSALLVLGGRLKK